MTDRTYVPALCACGASATALYVNLDAAYRYEDQMAEWNREHAGFVGRGELMLAPDQPAWVLACDEHYTYGNNYVIDIKGKISFRELVGWSAHLHEKNWFAGTDWSSLLYGLIGAQG